MISSDELLGANAFPLTIAEVWRERCEKTPDHIFVAQADQQLTYHEFDQLSDQAVAFLDQQQLVAGDVVAIQMATCLTSVQLMIACLKRQLTILPLNPHLDQEEALALIGRFQPNLIVTQADGRNSLSFENISQIGYMVNHTKLTSVPLITLSSAQRQTKYSADQVQPVVILCTSGTTSFAKGVMLSNQNVLYSELQFNRIYGITATDVLVLPSGFYHAIGFHHGLVSTILAGSSMVLMQHYLVAGLHRLIDRYHCTYLVTVPTVIYDVLNWYQRPSSLTRVISGGARLDDDLMMAAKAVQLPIYNIYGLTESAPFLCTSPAYFKMKQAETTAGYPIDGVQVKLIDEQQREIKQTDRIGQIIVRGPVVFQGYYRDTGETQKALNADGWFQTGDLGHWNHDSALEIDGRSKDMIIRGGENVSTYIVERELRRHPGIKEAAVVGLKNRRLGEIIGAFIIMQPDYVPLSLDQIKKFFAENHMAKKFWPEKVVVVTDFPMTSSGKIKKHLLIKMVEHGCLNDVKPVLQHVSGDNGWGR